MPNNYHTNLVAFKKSLIGGSEKDILLREIKRHASSNRLRWLDLGIGSGDFSGKLIRALELGGFDIYLTGVDVDKKALDLARNKFPNANFICSDFENLKLNDKFDIIYLSQSLYYSKSKKKLINYLASHLAEGGLLIVVLWSKNDTLYKLHKKVYSNNFGLYHSEKAYDLLSSFKCFDKIIKKTFKGKVNLTEWKDSESYLNLVEKIISRIASVDITKKSPKLKLLRKELAKLSDLEPRENGIIIAKKKYSIFGFSRRNVLDLLKLRFPNYKEKVSLLSGDKEALFMGSWEKETEYLSKYTSPERVLELCSAAGLRSIILAKQHQVVAIENNLQRINAARKNARLFSCSNKITFILGDVCNKKLLISLGDFSTIYIDADWRKNMKDPIKKQSLNPFQTTPRTDKLLYLVRTIFPKSSIILKISPFVRAKDLQRLGFCKIEEVYIDNKFLSYNVYFSPKIKENSYTQIFL